MNRRRQFEWPWKDILYFASSLVVITLALVVAATLFVENANLQNRMEFTEDFIATIPGLLKDLRKDLCDKVDSLREDLTNRIEIIEGSFQQLIEKGAPDGYAPLNNEAIVPDEFLPFNLMNAMFLGNDGGGCWDPLINTPLLISGQQCTIGEYYVSNNTGAAILDGFGGINDLWQVGDALICTGDIGWKRVRDIPRVMTWNNMTGDIVAFLDSLLDVDQTGASLGDVMVLSPGNIWKPKDCCVTGLGDPPRGFFAMLDDNFPGSPDPGDDDDDDFPQHLRSQWCFPRVWQSVNFKTTGRFPVGKISPVMGGAIWNPTDPNFVHIPHDFSTAPNNLFFGSGTYTIPETGWWHVQSKIRPRLAVFYGMRLFRLNNGMEAIYQQDSAIPGSGPVLTIEGTFAFCEGEVLQMQFFQAEGNDDTGDTPCLIEDPSGPFDDPLRFPPDAGGMYWNMWKVSNILMPVIQICSGFNLKKRDHNEEPIVYPTTWEDPALVYRLEIQRWEQNTAFYNQQCGGPVNCTHYKPGPKPEMPSILKPPPALPTEPPDSELKK